MQAQREAAFGSFARLIGYSLMPTQPSAGDTLTLEIVWHLAGQTTQPYTTFVHLLGPPDASGNIIYSQHDGQPCEGSYPSSRWQPDNNLLHRYYLPLPADMATGDYTLQVGWYDLATGLRAPVSDKAGSQPDDAFQLQTIRVQSP